MNNCSFTGRLTRDAELRYIAGSGTPVCTFTLAVDRNYTTRNGERLTDFINHEILGRGAEKLAGMLKKGMLIGTTGSLQINNTIDKRSNLPSTYTSIRVADVNFLEPKNSTRQQSNTQQEPEFIPSFDPQGLDPQEFQAIDDDDLPF